MNQLRRSIFLGAFCAFIFTNMSLFAGSRINPGAYEGARPMEYRTTVYVDQNYPIPITQADVVGGIVDINQQGWYALSEKITGTINITSDYVKLDGKGYDIDGRIEIKGSYITIDLQGGWVHGGAFGVKIFIQNGRSDIIIMNGTVDGNSTYAGIDASYCSKILIRNVSLHNVYNGFKFINVQEASLEQCTVENAGATGFLFNLSSNILLRDCIVRNAKLGFVILSDNTVVSSCKAFNMERGFQVGGDNIIFDQCIAEDITSTATDAFGFYIYNFSNIIIIKNCLINYVTSTPASAYGIYCQSEVSECAIIDNIVGNVSGSTAGVGIQGYDYMLTNNVVARNICYQNDTNYDGFILPALDVQSGYPGVSFMYNVALPTAP